MNLCARLAFSCKGYTKISLICKRNKDLTLYTVRLKNNCILRKKILTASKFNFYHLRKALKKIWQYFKNSLIFNFFFFFFCFNFKNWQWNNFRIKLTVIYWYIYFFKLKFFFYTHCNNPLQVRLLQIALSWMIIIKFFLLIL